MAERPILYQTSSGPVVELDGGWYSVAAEGWDELINHPDLTSRLLDARVASQRLDRATLAVHPPIGSQEVWAAGVTYLRSRAARVTESSGSGGGSYYDRVYEADRPEVFFKTTAHRVTGDGQNVRIRSDSRWSVPEPELALVLNKRGEIVGHTVGNDMSARDIEGDNPLYLTQAKIYTGCCGLGPGVLVGSEALPEDTGIQMDILREGQLVFAGSTRLSAMKRSREELVGYLMRENAFPSGCVLLTGTGIVPPDEFSLAAGDEIRIAISGLGTLTQTVAP